MFRLLNDQLPETASPPSKGAPAWGIDLDQSLAPLARIDFQNQYVLPGIQQTAEPTSLTAVTPQNTDEPFTIDVPETLVQVDAVQIGNQTYTPALSNPQPGQFTFEAGVLTISPKPRTPQNSPIVIFGGTESTPTDWVDPSILGLFYGLPVVAQVQWSMTAEAHPSGSINLRVLGDMAESQVARRFRKGTEITFAGVGFSVSSYSKKLLNTFECPDREFEVSISLAGKWERRKYNQPTTILPPEYRDPLFPRYQDPDCQLGADGKTKIRTNKPEVVSVQTLARRVGASFTGGSPGSVSVTGDWEIPVPKDATQRDTTSFFEVADQLKRQNGTLMDFNSPIAVRARSINSGANWAYRVPEISISYKGDCQNVSGVEGYAVEYRAVKLTGKFSEPVDPETGEDTQGEPKTPPKVKWKKREVKVKTFKSGDKNPMFPPETFPLIRNMNMTIDTSGPSKEEVIVTTHDGIEMLKIRRVYGAVFNSDMVMQDADEGTPIGNSGRKRGPIIADSLSFWGLTTFERTETIFDEKTRYILGSRTTGNRSGRFLQESDKLEILDFIGPREAGESDEDYNDRIYRESLYRFKQFPIYSVDQKKLITFGSIYEDASKEPIPVDYEKRCNPDGTAEIVPVANPNFAEPMFAIAHLTYSNSFENTRNPDSTPEDPLPDLTQGEERQTYKTIQILPSQKTIADRFMRPFKEIVLDYDSFIEHTWESSTQGAAFGEYTSRRTFSTNDGRPPVAQRLPDLYEKEEPEKKEGDPNIFQKDEFEYILCTPGHDQFDPSAGSLNFPHAKYLRQALRGAETDLKYRDVMESIEYSATIPTNFAIRPFDLVSLHDGHRSHQTRVISVENTILIQGQVNDYPEIVAPQNTQIRAGIDRVIPVTNYRRLLPKKPEPPKPSRANNDDRRNFELTLGEVLPRSMKGRGNY